MSSRSLYVVREYDGLKSSQSLRGCTHSLPPCSVRFQGTNGYTVTYGTYNTTGQNVSFTSARVVQTGPGFSAVGKTGTVSSFSNINNGGSQCVSIAWSDNSPNSTFLATLTKGIGGYGTYLEEGTRTFSTTAVTGAVNSCPNDSNLPFQCNQGSYPLTTIATIYSYTCYAIIKSSFFN